LVKIAQVINAPWGVYLYFEIAYNFQFLRLAPPPLHR